MYFLFFLNSYGLMRQKKTLRNPWFEGEEERLITNEMEREGEEQTVVKEKNKTLIVREEEEQTVVREEQPDLGFIS